MAVETCTDCRNISCRIAYNGRYLCFGDDTRRETEVMVPIPYCSIKKGTKTEAEMLDLYGHPELVSKL